MSTVIEYWGAIAYVSLLATVPSALAQPRRVAPIVVAADPQLEADAVAAEISLRQFLQKDARCEPVDLFAIAAGDSRAQRAKEGAAHLAEARDLLDGMNYETALREANDAVAAYEDADLTGAFPALLDSIAIRALVLHSAEGEGRMHEELVRLFTLKRDYQLDPMRVSPVYMRAVARARAEVGGASRVTLEVRSAPTPAEIFVDGVYRGIGAVAVAGLAPGVHYVTSRALGRELAQERTLVGVGTPVQVLLRPAAAERGLLHIIEQIRMSSSLIVADGAAALAKWADANEALIVVLQKKDEQTRALAALHSRDGRLLAAADGVLARSEEVTELAARMLVSPEPLSGRQTLALALGSGGFAALGTGVVFSLLTRQSYEAAKKLIDAFDEERFTAAKSATVRNSVLAHVACGLGAVALGMALYLGLSRGKPDAPPGAWLSAAPTQGGVTLSFAGGF